MVENLTPDCEQLLKDIDYCCEDSPCCDGCHTEKTFYLTWWHGKNYNVCCSIADMIDIMEQMEGE